MKIKIMTRLIKMTIIIKMMPIKINNHRIVTIINRSLINHHKIPTKIPFKIHRSLKMIKVTNYLQIVNSRMNLIIIQKTW